MGAARNCAEDRKEWKAFMKCEWQNFDAMTARPMFFLDQSPTLLSDSVSPGAGGDW